jgi:radical SAM superfamily enzyme YgiQ (UPF0313 family)
MYNKKMVHRPIEKLVELIKRVKQKKMAILFLDDNIYANPRYAKELFRALKELKVKWVGQSSLDIAKDEEALRLAKESGCRQLLIGYEISDTSQYQKTGGKFHMAEDYMALTKTIKKAKIPIKANFIFGFDSDTTISYWKMWWFCFRIFPAFSALTFLTPYPGTKFFNECIQSDRLTNLNWRNFNFHNFVFEHSVIPTALLNRVSYFVYVFFVLTTSRFGCILFVFILLNTLI